MTLDEAIKRAEEVAEMKKTLSEESELQGCSMYAIRCGKSAEEHRQLAEWLRELKAIKKKDNPRTIIYIDSGETVKTYHVGSNVAKAVMTLLEADNALMWSETLPGYGVEIVDKAESEV